MWHVYADFPLSSTARLPCLNHLAVAATNNTTLCPPPNGPTLHGALTSIRHDHMASLTLPLSFEGVMLPIIGSTRVFAGAINFWSESPLIYWYAHAALQPRLQPFYRDDDTTCGWLACVIHLQAVSSCL